MKCPCKFLDFSSYIRVFYHLFFSKWTNNYINRYTCPKNYTDAHNIMGHLQEHPKKVWDDFVKGVVHINQTGEHLQFSDKD